MGVLTERKAHDCPLPVVADVYSCYFYACDCGAEWQWQSAWDLPQGESIRRSWWERKKQLPAETYAVNGRWCVKKTAMTDVVIST